MVETRMGAPEVDLITFIAHLGSVETVGRKAIFRIGEPVRFYQTSTLARYSQRGVRLISSV